ncbi:PIG-L deacetylase family protein [Microbaculum marinum]|uniref:PIG-L deacetylase family protein n=1 Tax=Microbaculum marinum TaxID=1764581 RepID=A0AAW9RZL6_9HYPH
MASLQPAPCDRDRVHWTASDFHRGKPILVLSPHPDDESLGCGALLAECFESVGAHVACITDGRHSHRKSRQWPGPRLAALRQCELLSAVSILGGEAEDVTFLGFHDCDAPEDEADQLQTAMRLQALCERLDVGAVFSPSGRDPHKDHLATFGIARRLHEIAPSLRMFVYPVWSRWHDARAEALGPRSSLRIHAAACRLAQKQAAIAAHRSQSGRVVTDDPEGFTMPPGFAEFFARSDEYYFEGIA